MGERTSLNGGKTQPLTKFARSVLAQIAQSPVPAQSVNPGVRDRLTREDLVEMVQLTSPYMIHRGGTCWHLRITDAGRAELEKQWRAP